MINHLVKICISVVLYIKKIKAHIIDRKKKRNFIREINHRIFELNNNSSSYEITRSRTIVPVTSKKIFASTAKLKSHTNTKLQKLKKLKNKNKFDTLTDHAFI